MPHVDPEKRRESNRLSAARRRERLGAAGLAARREYRAANAEKINETRRQRRVARQTEDGAEERRAATNLWLKAYRYGWTPAAFKAWYERTWAAQDAACAVCKTAFNPAAEGLGVPKGRAVVDHEHVEGGGPAHLRGLLCGPCNIQVGFVEKDTSRAIAAVDYVLADIEKRNLDSGWPDD